MEHENQEHLPIIIEGDKDFCEVEYNGKRFRYHSEENQDGAEDAFINEPIPPGATDEEFEVARGCARKWFWDTRK